MYYMQNLASNLQQIWYTAEDLPMYFHVKFRHGSKIKYQLENNSATLAKKAMLENKVIEVSY